jgi:hypothetical protein
MGRCRFVRSCRVSCDRGKRIAATLASSLTGIESRSDGAAQGRLLHSDVLLHLADARAAERTVSPAENARRPSHSNVLLHRRCLLSPSLRTRAVLTEVVSTTCSSQAIGSQASESGTPLARVRASFAWLGIRNNVIDFWL